MAQAKVEELVDEIRSLTVEEQQQLRNLLEPWFACAHMTEEERSRELERRLLAQGVLRSIPPPITDFTAYQNRRPIEIEGEPLSKTIIRDREPR